MSTSLMYFTQGIRGFQHVSYDFTENGVVYEKIRRNGFRCQRCRSGNVSATPLRTRHIQSGKYGSWQLYFIVDVHRIYCSECGERAAEEIPFISHPKARITKELERTIIELRQEMSISAIAKYFDLNWRTVKNVDKRYLQKKYKEIKLENVKIIGLDEICVHHKRDAEKFITIVRDLSTGAVLYVGKGKGIDSLKVFTKRLRRAKCKIEAITMDMSKSYEAWAREVLPDAELIFDHFHLVKLMNDKLDKIRRRTAAKLNEEQKKKLKNQRFLFLRKVEDLSADSEVLLNELRNDFKELGDAHMMKEYMRSIYYEAQSDQQAKAAFKDWCTAARATEIKELVDMAKTIERHIDGITAFWRNNFLSNASMEGFNNKIRWLIRQAYGYRDEEYFHLKIFDLPHTNTRRNL